MLYGYKPHELPSSATQKALIDFRQEFDELCRRHGVESYLFKFDWVCPDTGRYYEPIAIKSEDIDGAYSMVEQLFSDISDWADTINPHAEHDVNDRTN